MSDLRGLAAEHDAVLMDRRPDRTIGEGNARLPAAEQLMQDFCGRGIGETTVVVEAEHARADGRQTRFECAHGIVMFLQLIGVDFRRCRFCAGQFAEQRRGLVDGICTRLAQHRQKQPVAIQVLVVEPRAVFVIQGLREW